MRNLANFVYCACTHVRQCSMHALACVWVCTYGRISMSACMQMGWNAEERWSCYVLKGLLHLIEYNACSWWWSGEVEGTIHTCMVRQRFTQWLPTGARLHVLHFDGEYSHHFYINKQAWAYKGSLSDLDPLNNWKRSCDGRYDFHVMTSMFWTLKFNRLWWHWDVACTSFLTVIMYGLRTTMHPNYGPPTC